MWRGCEPRARGSAFVTSRSSTEVSLTYLSSDLRLVTPASPNLSVYLLKRLMSRKRRTSASTDIVPRFGGFHGGGVGGLCSLRRFLFPRDLSRSKASDLLRNLKQTTGCEVGLAVTRRLAR